LRPPLAGAGWIVVHPRYRRRFVRRGLTTAADFIDLPGEVVSGHANRHVVRVVFGRGLSRFVAFVKREHRIPWRERLTNLCDGFAWASKSEREARTLSALRRAGVAVPRWLAYGEDGAGRAFLLVRAEPGAIELRRFLQDDRPAWQRRELARRLGDLLARVHAAGFNCPDLSSKHVLVRPRGLVPVLIDWQRAVRTMRVRWSVRARELALLHVTLADELATPRDRLACLHAYLRRALGTQPALRSWAKLVIGQTARLANYRSVQELRRPPLAGKAQRLRWIDGESLVVTRPFWRACRGRVPGWLVEAANSFVEQPHESPGVWRGRRVVLRQFPPAGRWRRWWNRLCGRHIIAAGPRLGGQLFRLERLGVAAMRPLAFGQRPDGGSFILLKLLPHPSEGVYVSRPAAERET
jgi:tRNA A-37 threonylcarbamoyl transferase component Bud32